MVWHWCWLWWGWGARSRTRSSQELLCGSRSGFSRAPSSRKPLLRSQGKASAMVAPRSSHQRTSHHRHQQRAEPSWRGRRTRQSFPCSDLPGPSPFLEALWRIALRRKELKLCLPSKWMNCTQICLYMHRKNATQLEWFNQVFIVLLLFHAKNKVKWAFRSPLFLFPYDKKFFGRWRYLLEGRDDGRKCNKLLVELLPSIPLRDDVLLSLRQCCSLKKRSMSLFGTARSTNPNPFLHLHSSSRDTITLWTWFGQQERW